MITLTKVWQVSPSVLTEKVHLIIKKGQIGLEMIFYPFQQTHKAYK